MNRLAVALLALALLAAPLVVEAQPAGKPFRIGVLGDFRPTQQLWAAFIGAFRERGWVADQNIAFEYRYAEQTKLPELATDLVRLNVDLILTTAGVNAVRAAKGATSRIPIVTLAITDPVAFGLVASVMRPGGNVTGISDVVGFEIVGRRLELLKQLVPSVRRVAWMHSRPVTTQIFQENEARAKALGITLLSVPADGPEEFRTAFAVMIHDS